MTEQTRRRVERLEQRNPPERLIDFSCLNQDERDKLREVLQGRLDGTMSEEEAEKRCAAIVAAHRFDDE